MSERAKRLLNQLIDKPQVVIPGTVESVDLAKLKCRVQPTDGGAVLVVRLRPVLEAADDGLLVVPAEGSAVVVLMLDEHTSLLIATTTVQLYSIRTGNESLKAVLHDLVAALKLLKVTTPSGLSGVATPDNQQALTAIQNRLNNLFHS